MAEEFDLYTGPCKVCRRHKSQSVPYVDQTCGCCKKYRLTEEWRPCPFCGDRDRLIIAHDGPKSPLILCRECLAQGPPFEGTVKEAVRAWNGEPSEETKALLATVEYQKETMLKIWAEALAAMFDAVIVKQARYGPEHVLAAVRQLCREHGKLREKSDAQPDAQETDREAREGSSGELPGRFED